MHSEKPGYFHGLRTGFEHLDVNVPISTGASKFLPRAFSKRTHFAEGFLWPPRPLKGYVTRARCRVVARH